MPRQLCQGNRCFQQSKISRTRLHLFQNRYPKATSIPARVVPTNRSVRGPIGWISPIEL
jgi:hypothetical protein